ncbi:UNVERIFIED_CONTAM: hypothetical protein Sradi_1304500 [Sesamum radiatum]|uniref:Reverse transcriptase zinc-binding domain-containing protein n=1 Tax=Sesamum radiatum TaxID=300843 RepID=A0AAW2UPY4_SESRA
MEPVSYYWHEGDWNVSRILRTIPMPFAQIICQISIAAGQGDKIVWTESSTGDFSTKSAWEAIRQASPRRQLLADVWHRFLRPTISVFLWRLFQDRIPMDAQMRQKGFSFPSKCQCCEAEETVSHLFIESTAVQGVWQHFAAIFGLCLCDTGSLTYMFTWTQRNATKYRGVSFSTDGIILEVQRHLRTLYATRTLTSTQWKGDLHQAAVMGFIFRQQVPRAPSIFALGTGTSVLAKLTAVWRGMELALTTVLPLGGGVTLADVQHVFREANSAADHLAKEAASLQLTRVLHHDDITGVLRDILCLDRQGVPHLRRG